MSDRIFLQLCCSLLVGLQLLTAPLTIMAEEQVVIELKDTEAYGSGASTSDLHYYAGGVPNVGLYIGNPNNTVRNDRALFLYDLTPLLLKADKIKKAELIFSIEYYDSDEPQLELEVDRLRFTPDILTGQELNAPDAEQAGTVVLTLDDAVRGPQGVRNVPEKVLNVTAAVKADLSEGLTTSTYRFKIPQIEATHVSRPTHGVHISTEKTRLPVLQVTLE